MLVALTENRQPFIINPNIPRSTLRKVREENHFFCPQCGEKLLFKIGSVKVPHFAHANKNNCETYFSEGETEQHLLGKEQLYRLFQYLQLPVQLEPFLSSIKQRPDLLVLNRFAIEFQCAPIKNEYLMERNQGYYKQNIQPVWIVLTPTQVHGTGIQKLSFPLQMQQFLTSTKNIQYVITYNPNKKQFIYLSNLIYLYGYTFLTKISRLSLFQQKFPFYIPKPLSLEEFSFALKAYDSFKEEYLKRRILISRKGVNDFFLRSVYELRLNHQHLPIFLGIPIVGSELFKVCPVEWQTALLYFIHFHEIKIHAINRANIFDFLNWAKMKNTKKAIDVVERYCRVLQQLSVETIDRKVSQRQLEHLLYKQFLASEGKY